ncbi:MAG: hypothetical protein Q8L27_00230 [archaeon]|nr:hypothetical protein [archaeon]
MITQNLKPKSCNLNYNTCGYYIKTDSLCRIDDNSCSSSILEQSLAKCTPLPLDLSKVPNANVSVAEIEHRDSQSHYPTFYSHQARVEGFPGQLYKEQPKTLDFEEAKKVKDTQEKKDAIDRIIKIADHLVPEVNKFPVIKVEPKSN